MSGWGAVMKYELNKLGTMTHLDEVEHRVGLEESRWGNLDHTFLDLSRAASGGGGGGGGGTVAAALSVVRGRARSLGAELAYIASTLGGGEGGGEGRRVGGCEGGGGLRQAALAARVESLAMRCGADDDGGGEESSAGVRHMYSNTNCHSPAGARVLADCLVRTVRAATALGHHRDDARDELCDAAGAGGRLSDGLGRLAAALGDEVAEQRAGRDAPVARFPGALRAFGQGLAAIEALLVPAAGGGAPTPALLVNLRAARAMAAAIRLD